MVSAAMLNHRQVEIFRAVMRIGTVRGAAARLGVAQPGLSRMLRHMEDRLGFALFDRSSGRLVPTQEAHLLMAQVERVHKELADLDHVARRLAAGEDRLFRVAASPSLGHSVLPALLKRLIDRFPDLVLQFDILSVDQTDDYLALDRGDVTLTLFPMAQPNVHSVRLGAGRLVAAVHADHPLAGAGTLSVGRLAGESLISFRADTPHGRAIAALFGGEGPPIRTYVRFAETAVAFVAQGLGIALVDSFTAAQPHDSAVRILPLVERGELPVYLNRDSQRPMSAAGSAFEAIARAALR
ncbi:LysR family transcriptional regulator [Sphingomonas naphthae]|uniref:LysR family transcriptional regulator n=1 Tax=Sphingomonas naphthae TaxID=1813468 RepID=A0ABY7TIZ6_9SPHN|nr:LysR family transcriptional regulator [Sphingomonas naphthae]WCT72863.1 LysR family transcriptional regulator [Sphingomonas naphthae]